MKVIDKKLSELTPYANNPRFASCVTANGTFLRVCDKCYISDGDFINAQSFPQDYDFCKNDVQYVCGMSVPPNMMAHIATEIYNQWFK